MEDGPPPPTLFEWLLQARGLSMDTFKDFVDPDIAKDPLFEKAGELAAWLRSLPPGRCMINADYDVDGTTSAAIIGKVLARLGWKVGAFVPDRFTENYGVNYGVIENEHDHQPFELLVCVDCGATELAKLGQVADARKLQVVVIDHHKRVAARHGRVQEFNPHCHPEVAANGYSAGVLCALVAERVAERQDEVARILRETRVLAGLSAMADVVSMRTTANRFCALQCLKEWQRDDANIGLRFLMQSCGLRGTVTSGEISFRVAPLINAAGRLDHARQVVNLFSARDADTAAQITGQLRELNSKRVGLQHSLETAACQKLVEGKGFLLAYDQQWHPGVVGPAAGRLAERHGVVVFLGGYLPDLKEYSFSGRSVEGVDLHALFSRCAARLSRPIHFGGHAAALGFRVAAGDVQRVCQELEAALTLEKIKRQALRRNYDAHLSPATVSHHNVSQLRKLEPFGVDNPTPLFCVPNVKVALTPMRNYPNSASGVAVGRDGASCPVVVFQSPELSAQKEFRGHLIGELLEDQFRDEQTVKLKITDWISPTSATGAIKKYFKGGFSSGRGSVLGKRSPLHGRGF